jgi:hypothetical protein
MWDRRIALSGPPGGNPEHLDIEIVDQLLRSHLHPDRFATAVNPHMTAAQRRPTAVVILNPQIDTAGLVEAQDITPVGAGSG